MDVSLEHQFPVPRASVFDGFIDMYGDDRPDWIVDSHLDLRVGGAWTVTFEPPGVDRFTEERKLIAVDRPDLLAYDMALVLDGATQFRTRVRFAFSERDGGTRLQFTQTGFPDEKTRDDFGKNWAVVFDQLEERLIS
jgi:uncharacterized protein YndB with AHSA1/START domain